MTAAALRDVLGLALLALAGVTAFAQEAVNPQAAALKEFADRAEAYMRLHASIALELPPVSTDATPEAIAEHRERLAAGIRAARRDARESDVFTPPVAGQVRLIVRRDIKSRDMKDVLAALADDAYVLDVHVNAPWPADLPRVTLPPRLLTSLSTLPNGLEYRLYDRHLVLVDVDAQLIVDLVRNVVPSSVRPRR